MEEKDALRFKERSIGDLLDQFGGEGGSDGPFHHRPPRASPSDPEARHLYYQDGFLGQNSLPFIFNTREDILPAMVDVGGGNFMVYGTPNAHKNHMANLHFSKKTNGNLSAFNDYGVEYKGADYNLFSGNMPPVQTHSEVPAFHQQASVPKAQIIENLVGNWTQNQNGTYSPFGSCMGGSVRTPMEDDMSIGRGCKRTRIVAEVKPMRPSYSDVLAKSINSTTPTPTANTSQKPRQDSKQKPCELSAAKLSKASKSSAGRSLSGSGNSLHRQNSAVLDDQSFMGLRTTGLKKSDHEPQEGLSKKWLSLDDLKDACQEEFISIAKKSSPKAGRPAGKQQKPGEKVEGLSGTKPAGSVKQPSSKREPKTKEKGGKEQDVKVETGKAKAGGGAEERRSGQSKTDSHKSTRRNSRQAEKHGKGGGGGRSKRRDQEHWLSIVVKQHLDHYCGFLLRAVHWLLRLVFDVFGMSAHLAIHMFTVIWVSTVSSTVELHSKLLDTVRNIAILQTITNHRWWPFKKQKQKESHDSGSEEDSDAGGSKPKNKLPKGLKHNIPLPGTGDEAMKRLLACKGKDPYSILGVTQNCTDDDIKKYYKRQAFLVHPDKNNQPGAEEAFKILVHAFELIGEPEHRKSYDRRVEKTQQVEQAWSELSDLLSKLHKKMEHVANTIRCTNCGKRHKRSPVDRPMYAARLCAQCKIHHSAREGDIWAETSLFGMMWHYYACMDGGVYDVTEWAGCQGGQLRNLKPNTHAVQYRIVLDKQKGQKQKFQQANPVSEPDLEDFLSNLYTKADSGSGTADMADMPGAGPARKRKTKKK